jgi:hypothetical protein
LPCGEFASWRLGTHTLIIPSFCTSIVKILIFKQNEPRLVIDLEKSPESNKL